MTTNIKQALSSMLNELSPTQLDFVAARILCQTDKEAADMLDTPVQTIYNWPNKQAIDEVIILCKRDALELARARLRVVANEAISVLMMSMRKRIATSRTKAANDILDRAGVTRKISNAVDVTSAGERIGGEYTDGQRANIINQMLAASTEETA